VRYPVQGSDMASDGYEEEKCGRANLDRGEARPYLQKNLRLKILAFGEGAIFIFRRISVLRHFPFGSLIFPSSRPDVELASTLDGRGSPFNSERLLSLIHPLLSVTHHVRLVLPREAHEGRAGVSPAAGRRRFTSGEG